MIIKNIEDIRKNIPVTKAASLIRLQPFLDEAEDEFESIIGKAMYSAFDIYTETPANAHYDKVLSYIRKALANKAYYLGFDIMNAVISEQGMHRIETEDGSKKALFQRQEENIKNNLRITAYRNIDKALAYMEANKAEFGAWSGSPEYTLALRNFINSTADYMKYYDINSSRLLFGRLRVYQTQAEDFEILPAIGRDFFDELKTEISAGNLSAENKTFLPFLQRAVAHASIYYAGHNFNYMLTDFGFQNSEFTSNSANFKEQKSNSGLSEKIITKAKELADRYLRSAIEFLKLNVEDYPTYADSDAYAESSLNRPQGTDKILMI